MCEFFSRKGSTKNVVSCFVCFSLHFPYKTRTLTSNSKWKSWRNEGKNERNVKRINSRAHEHSKRGSLFLNVDFVRIPYSRRGCCALLYGNIEWVLRDDDVPIKIRQAQHRSRRNTRTCDEIDGEGDGKELKTAKIKNSRNSAAFALAWCYAMWWCLCLRI